MRSRQVLGADHSSLRPSSGRQTLHQLNSRLASYLQQAEHLGRTNQRLERQIQEELSRRRPVEQMELDGLLHSASLLQEQVAVRQSAGAGLKLQLLEAELSVFHLNSRCEQERARRRLLEEDLSDLRLLQGALRLHELPELQRLLREQEQELQELQEVQERHQQEGRALPAAGGAAVEMQIAESWGLVQQVEQLRRRSRALLEGAQVCCDEASVPRVPPVTSDPAVPSEEQQVEQLRRRTVSLMEELRRLQAQVAVSETSGQQRSRSVLQLLLVLQEAADRLSLDLDSALGAAGRRASDRRVLLDPGSRLETQIQDYRRLLDTGSRLETQIQIQDYRPEGAGTPAASCFNRTVNRSVSLRTVQVPVLLSTTVLKKSAVMSINSLNRTHSFQRPSACTRPADLDGGRVQNSSVVQSHVPSSVAASGTSGQRTERPQSSVLTKTSSKVGPGATQRPGPVSGAWLDSSVHVKTDSISHRTQSPSGPVRAEKEVLPVPLQSTTVQTPASQEAGGRDVQRPEQGPSQTRVSNGTANQLTGRPVRDQGVQSPAEGRGDRPAVVFTSDQSMLMADRSNWEPNPVPEDDRSNWEPNPVPEDDRSNWEPNPVQEDDRSNWEPNPVQEDDRSNWEPNPVPEDDRSNWEPNPVQEDDRSNWEPNPVQEDDRSNWEPNPVQEDDRSNWEPNPVPEDNRSNWEPNPVPEDDRSNWEPNPVQEDDQSNWEPNPVPKDNRSNWEPNPVPEDDRSNWEPNPVPEDDQSNWEPNPVQEDGADGSSIRLVQEDRADGERTEVEKEDEAFSEVRELKSETVDPAGQDWQTAGSRFSGQPESEPSAGPTGPPSSYRDQAAQQLLTISSPDDHHTCLSPDLEDQDDEDDDDDDDVCLFLTEAEQHVRPVEKYILSTRAEESSPPAGTRGGGVTLDAPPPGTSSEGSRPAPGEPLEVRGEPLEVRGEPLEVRGEPLEVRGEPLEVRGEPLEVRGEPLEVRGEPQEVRGEPQEVRGEPLEVRGEPLEVRGEPQEVRGEPLEVRGEPQEWRFSISVDQAGSGAQPVSSPAAAGRLGSGEWTVYGGSLRRRGSLDAAGGAQMAAPAAGRFGHRPVYGDALQRSGQRLPLSPPGSLRFGGGGGGERRVYGGASGRPSATAVTGGPVRRSGSAGSGGRLSGPAGTQRISRSTGSGQSKPAYSAASRSSAAGAGAQRTQRAPSPAGGPGFSGGSGGGSGGGRMSASSGSGRTNSTGGRVISSSDRPIRSSGSRTGGHKERISVCKMAALLMSAAGRERSEEQWRREKTQQQAAATSPLIQRWLTTSDPEDVDDIMGL